MDNQKKHLYIIDGYSYLFRAYHSLPPLTNKDGVAVGAVYGFTNMILKLKHDIVKQGDDNYLIIVFDSGKDTFRNELFPEYKAHRPPAPDDLIPQFSIVRDAARAMNIIHTEKQNYEADDIIAQYTRDAKKGGVKVTIVSSDKDLMQLIDDDVKMYDSMRSRIIGAEQVQEKFGVQPDKVADILALMGDSADNIPGVKGIGPKTAASLINQFGSVENLINNYNEIKNPRQKGLVESSLENLKISKELVLLNKKVDVDFTLEELKIKPFDKNILKDFLIKHNFRSILAKHFKHDNTLQVDVGGVQGERNLATRNNLQDNKSFPDIENILLKAKVRLITADNFDELNNEFESIVEKSPRLDVAMSSQDNYLILSFLSDADATQSILNFVDMDSFSSCIKNDREFAIKRNEKNDNKSVQDDLFSLPVQRENSSLDTLDAFCNQLILFLNRVFSDARCSVVFADSKSTLRHILSNLSGGIDSIPNLLVALGADYPFPRNFEDIQQQYYSLYGTSKKFDLINIVNDIWGANIAVDKLTYKLNDDKELTMLSLLFPIISRNLLDKVFKQNVSRIYHYIEKPLVKALLDIELNGFSVSKEKLNELNDYYNKASDELSEKIFNLTGEEFNLGSPKQLGEILFDKLQLAKGKKSKSGAYVTDFDTLDALSNAGHEVASLVLRWREFSKLSSTYTQSLAKEIAASTGRIYSTMNNNNTSTGRLSSAKPNLQNIPIRTEEGRKIRYAFVAESGKKLIDIDYSQIELRLLAHFADIKILQDAFKNGQDIHAATAAQIFHVPLNEVDSTMRRRAKTVNFGIIYGQGAFGLAKQLGISRTEAKEIIERYFEQYSGIKKYMENMQEFAREHEFVTTIFGRKIHLSDINSNNAMTRQFAERLAINAPLQGSAADIIKLAMVKLNNYLTQNYSQKQAKLILQIHDEVIIEVDEILAEEISKKAAQIMEKATILSVPLTVDVQIASNWGEGH